MQQFTVGTGRIVLDDQGKLVVNGRVPPLVGKERVVVVALLQQMARHQHEVRVPLWVPTADLCRMTKTPNQRALQNLISEARAQVWAWGLDIKSVRGEGYFIYEQTGVEPE
jgi:hypothetical protein